MASINHLNKLDLAPRACAAGLLRLPGRASLCPLCGSSDTCDAFKDNGCRLRVCTVCDLFFVDPYPASAEQHKQVSSGTYRKIEILDCARRYQGERLFYDRHFDLISKEVQGATSLLDVGCGTGNLLERLRIQPRLHRVGIELNSQVAQFARRTAACNISGIPIEQFRSARQFDVITMINVFSHIPSFDGLFHSLHAALRPGGKLILRTSEMARNVSRWNQVHWGVPDDLHFLGLRTLDFLCAQYGFAVARHIRTPFEDELFRPSRWQQMGRSRLRNFIKSVGTHIPLALPTLKHLYTATLGQRLYVSFIVLVPLSANEKACSARVAHLRAQRVSSPWTS